MSSKGHMSGMRGVFLVAAELSARGFIVSPTSRSAKGADLLVTDQECRKAWSVQVKTNGRNQQGVYNFWLLNAHAMKLKSDSHVYVFVTLPKGDERPEFIVAGSHHVAAKTRKTVSKTGKQSVWYEFFRKDRPSEGEGWEIFGDPHATGDDADAVESNDDSA